MKPPLLVVVAMVRSEGMLHMVAALSNLLLAARSLPYALRCTKSLEKWLSVGSHALSVSDCISYLVICSSVK